MKHHILSPSKYPGLNECVLFTQKSRTSAVATAGTVAHDEARKQIEEGIEADSNVSRWFAETTIGLANGNKVICEYRAIAKMPIIKGIYGYIDAHWWDDGALHIVDYKTFSDGTRDYTMQLLGYASLMYWPDFNPNTKVVCHILHGGIFKIETFETTFKDAYDKVVSLVTRIKQGGKPRLNSHCQFCSKINECEVTMNAIETVKSNPLSFQNLSLPQKLVVIDVVKKLINTIEEEAKEEARKNGGVLEQDGIRYEMKPWAGPAKMRDIKELAGALLKPTTDDGVAMIGMTHDELLSLCNVSKTKLIAKLKEKNKVIKAVKKVDIEKFVDGYYDATEGTPHFIRTK